MQRFSWYDETEFLRRSGEILTAASDAVLEVQDDEKMDSCKIYAQFALGRA